MSETELMLEDTELARRIMTLCGCAPASPSMEPGACEITDKIARMIASRRSPVAEGGGSDPSREELARALEAVLPIALTALATNNNILPSQRDAYFRARAALSKHRAPSPPAPSQEGASDTGDGSEPPPNPR